MKTVGKVLSRKNGHIESHIFTEGHQLISVLTFHIL